MISTTETLIESMTTTATVNRTATTTQDETSTSLVTQSYTFTKSVPYTESRDYTTTVVSTSMLSVTPLFTRTTGVDEISDGQVQHRTIPESYISASSIPQASKTPQRNPNALSSWTKLTPSPPAPTEAVRNHMSTFGIGVKTLERAAASNIRAISKIQPSEGSNWSLLNAVSFDKSLNYVVADAAQVPSNSLLSSRAEARSDENDSPWQSCKGSEILTLHLSDSVLYDSLNRVGSIVPNRQFQFDGPPPQSNAIYAAGWSIYKGLLTLGNQTKFYQCQSGDFFNLYDESIASYCEPIQLVILNLVDCD